MPEYINITCPHCGESIEQFKRPALTVDIIIEIPISQKQTGIILIKRKNPPYGWAIPGGFVDYGESVEEAAVREAKEETAVNVKIKRLLGVYSAPQRDPRGHTVSVAFIAEGEGTPSARDDAIELKICIKEALPQELAFDHAEILDDYFKSRPV
ncbi:MAG: NUDIX domain-containing protein [bacterium]